MLRIVGVLVLTAMPALADTKEDSFQSSAVHIATAYHCISVTGDEERYTLALDAGLSRMVAAGYSEQEARERIGAIQASFEAHTPTTLTAEFCADMLDLLEGKTRLN